MYFPLALWERVAADASTKGPKGGRFVGYQNAARRMTNSEFVELVRGGWIGTTLPQSAALTTVIEEILKTGKAVTFAIKDDPPPPEDGSDVTVVDSGWNEDFEDEEEEAQVLLQGNGN